jgi:hypothetical protein
MAMLRIGFVSMAAMVAGCFGSRAEMGSPDARVTTSDASSTPPDVRVEDAGVDDASTDSGVDGGGVDSGVDPGLPATEPRGQIRVERGDFFIAVDAQFVRQADSCSVERHGPCRLRRCPDDARGSEEVSAGPLVISTPTVEQSVLEPSRSRGMNLYRRNVLGDGDPDRLRPGDAIQIRAGGDIVPGFDTRVVFPESAEIDFEQRPQGTTVPSDEPMTLTWSGGARRDVLFARLRGGSELRAECSFTAAEGSASLPASLLETLRGDQERAPAELRVSVRRRRRIRAGDFAVDVSAEGAGRHSIRGGYLSFWIE